MSVIRACNNNAHKMALLLYHTQARRYIKNVRFIEQAGEFT